VKGKVVSWHAMKVYGGVVAPCILNLGIRGSWVVSSVPWPF